MEFVREVVWVFSDVHATADLNSQDIEKRQKIPTGISMAASPLDAWVSRLASAKAAIIDADLKPDWIVCAGDLATHDQNKEIGQTTKFLNAVATAYGVIENKIVVVPGNHDVDFAKADSARGLESFYASIIAAKFTNPRTENVSTIATKGCVPYPIDTTSLIGRRRIAEQAMAKVPRWVRFLTPGLEGTIEDAVRVEAALILPADLESRLASFVHTGRLEHGARFFPIAVSHHPIAQPPARKADTSTDDVTVHSALLKRRFIEHGIAVVIQGHRHDPVIHTERVVSSPALEGTPLVVITMPSLGYQNSFLILEILRAPNAAAHQIVGYFVTREDYHKPRRARPDVVETIVHDGQPRCREIRRVLYIDRTGRSRLDHYFFDVVGAQRVTIPLALDAHGGVFVSEPEHKVLSDQGGAGLSCRIDGDPIRPGVGKANISIVLEGAARVEKPAVWLRVQAVRCHAVSEQDAALMRPSASKYEATSFTIPLPVDHYELVIRFPEHDLVPKSSHDFHIFAVSPNNIGTTSPAEWASGEAPGHIRHLVSVETASVSIAAAAKRVFVGIRHPISGITYIVRWKLPSVAPKAADGEFVGAATRHNLRALLHEPAVYTWSELGVAAATDFSKLTGRNALEGVGGIVQRVVAVLALHLKDEPEFSELAASRMLEVALLGGPYNYGTSHERKGGRRPAWVGVLASVVPDEMRDWRRYRTHFSYGVGLGGLAFRTGTKFSYDSRYRQNETPAKVYCDSDDG